MSVVRAALMLSLGIIISVGIIVLFLHHKDRFTIVPQNKGIFIFDDKNSSVSFCTDKECTLISINADHAPFMQQGYGYMTPPQYPTNPQYSPYMPSPYTSQQNFAPQLGWVGVPNHQATPMIPAQPVQPQQQLMQPQQPQQQQVQPEQVQQQAQPEQQPNQEQPEVQQQAQPEQEQQQAQEQPQQ